jgi:hypothetical protein
MAIERETAVKPNGTPNNFSIGVGVLHHNNFLDFFPDGKFLAAFESIRQNKFPTL